jgi:YHS domain-containing protein
MLRDLLLLMLALLVARAVWRVVSGVLQGLSGQAGPSRGGRRSNAPARGVHMVRDPVCGIYVVPDRALALSHGSNQVYFCSADCRDKYRARPSGRTA